MRAEMCWNGSVLPSCVLWPKRILARVEIRTIIEAVCGDSSFLAYSTARSLLLAPVVSPLYAIAIVG